MTQMLEFIDNGIKTVYNCIPHIHKVKQRYERYKKTQINFLK